MAYVLHIRERKRENFQARSRFVGKTSNAFCTSFFVIPGILLFTFGCKKINKNNFHFVIIFIVRNMKNS